MLEAILGSLDGEEEDAGKEKSCAGCSGGEEEEGEEEKMEMGWGGLNEEESWHLLHLCISVGQDKGSHGLQKIGTDITLSF